MVPQRCPTEFPTRISRKPARGAAILGLVVLAASSGRAEEAQRGFNYCAPPLRPACIDAPEPPDDCERDVQAFIRTVFKYRSCLEKESERAVREANDALEAWKCYTGALKCR